MRVFLRVDPVTGLAGSIEAIDIKAANCHPEQNEGSSPIKIFGISLFSQESKKKSFRKGDSIEISLNATPGAEAVFDVCGIARGVAMKETKPGSYKGKFVFQRGDARFSYVIIRMKNKNGKITRIYPGSIDLAANPPEITPVSPTPGESISGNLPPIFAELSSAGSMVTASSATIYLDGKPLSQGIFRNVEYVSAELPQNLPPGAHRAKITVCDEAGNTASKEWSFTRTVPGK
jgi:hypothetical protein